MQRKVHCYKKYDINVGTATQNELIELVAHISRTSNIELQKVLAEADRAGKGDVLRMKWKQDVDERIAFDRDQKRNGKVNELTSRDMYVLFPSFF